ncbi:MAG: hypothetical protein HC792_06710 [Acaryochloridaceae cyanobacterium CSU_5_19]|nr:hypothetical protein [Acaryochloridaceae cyanobacterium CSU_5_19]
MVSERFPQALDALEQDFEELRIKKLIYYVCYRSWPSVTIPMDQMALSRLVPRLLNQVKTAEDLTILLSRKAARLNKSEAYLPIAQTISQILGPFCTGPTAATEIAITAEAKDAPSLPTQKEDHASAACPSSASTGKTYTIFDLKVALMQSTNPLKAKILLFSALFHPFSFCGRSRLVEFEAAVLGRFIATALSSLSNPKSIGTATCTHGCSNRDARSGAANCPGYFTGCATDVCWFNSVRQTSYANFSKVFSDGINIAIAAPLLTRSIFL